MDILELYWVRLAKVVTSLRTKNLHTSDTILGHSLYDLGQGTGNKVIYALVCSIQCFTGVLKHCELVLLVFHMVVYKLQFKAVLHVCVVKIACCKIVGLMHIGAYTDH